jgi:hypothetical protein
MCPTAFPSGQFAEGHCQKEWHHYNYDRAFQLARSNGIKVAWANEAFEIWYLLHFNYHDTGISRDDYKAKLKPNLDYDKADKTVYEKTKPFQGDAIRNARRLERHWNEMGERFPERQNPSMRSTNWSIS